MGVPMPNDTNPLLTPGWEKALAEMEALEKAATAGKWTERVGPNDAAGLDGPKTMSVFVAGIGEVTALHANDARLIAALRNAAPNLFAAISTLHARNAELTTEVASAAVAREFTDTWIEGLLDKLKAFDARLEDAIDAANVRLYLLRAENARLVEKLAEAERERDEALEQLRWRPISEIHEDNGDHVAIEYGEDGEIFTCELVSNLQPDFDMDDWKICVPVPKLTTEAADRLRAQIDAARTGERL